MSSPNELPSSVATSGVLSLITRVHEHDALVARTDVKIILAHVHTACRVRTLLYLAISEIQNPCCRRCSPMMMTLGGAVCPMRYKTDGSAKETSLSIRELRLSLAAFLCLHHLFRCSLWSDWHRASINFISQLPHPRIRHFNAGTVCAWAMD